jgi:regulator of replication initiation timing
MREAGLNELVNQIKQKKTEIAGKTSEIQNLMKENIDLRIENIQYL